MVSKRQIAQKLVVESQKVFFEVLVVVACFGIIDHGT